MDVMNPVSQVDTTQTEEPQSPEVAEATNDYEPTLEEYVAWLEEEHKHVRTKLSHYKRTNKNREEKITKLQRELKTVNRRLGGRREYVRHLEGSLILNNQENMLSYYQLAYLEYGRQKRRDRLKRFRKNLSQGLIDQMEVTPEEVKSYRESRKRTRALMKERAEKRKEFIRSLRLEDTNKNNEEDPSFLPMMV